MISYEALYQANKQSRKSVDWKHSVQLYQTQLLRNICMTHDKLSRGENVTRGFVEFNTIERGKMRHIRSVHYSERVVQRSLCDNALLPLLSRSLISDNGACLKRRGVDYALDRLDMHLHKFYRLNGFSNEGYIALFDFKGYFDSIRHDRCFEIYDRTFSDERIKKLLHDFIYPFGFPFADGNWRTTKRKLDPKEYTGLSLGLGSQVSQITAVSYPNVIDHYIKQVLHVKCYGRYMDDGYMMFRTKEEAREALDKVRELCANLGITVNERKTQIVKLTHPFVYLKVKHTLTSTGKVLRGLSRVSKTRERRKLKKLKKKLDNGEILLADIRQAYGSWKGYALRRNARASVRNMDALYKSLFGENAPVCKLERRKHHGRKQQNHAGADDRERHQLQVQH